MEGSKLDEGIHVEALKNLRFSSENICYELDFLNVDSYAIFVCSLQFDIYLKRLCTELCYSVLSLGMKGLEN